MKKFLLVLPLVLISLTGCGEVDPVPVADPTGMPIKESSDGTAYLFDFYALNDFHGAVLESADDEEPGMAKIGAYLRDRRNENVGGSVFLSSGDMFQGSAESNITRGKMVMEMMNLLDFSSTVVGNHEFDWGIETLIDSMEATEAKFPLLACNIKDKAASAASGEVVMADWATPYTIIERGVEDDLIQIGIIGSIATGLERSILTSAVANYEFLEPAPFVAAAATQMRAQGVDIIIYTTHGDANPASKGGAIDGSIPEYVDAIFCGHAHRTVNNNMNGVPVMEGLENAQEMSHVQLALDKASKEVSVVDLDQEDSNAYGETLRYAALGSKGSDASINAILNRYERSEIAAVRDEVVGSVDHEISESALGQFTTDEILKYAQSKDETVQFAFHNSGRGIRARLAPGNVTYGDIYKALPFDNAIYFVTIRGLYLKTMPSFISSPEPLPRIDNSTYYRIAMVSYLAEYAGFITKNDGTFDSNKVNVETIEIYNDYPRDIVADAFRNHATHRPLD